MDRLVTTLVLTFFFLHSTIAHETVKRSIFSWGKEPPQTKDSEIVPGYLPALQVHKYQGVQINPVNGPSIYLSNAPTHPSNDPITVNQFQSNQLSPEHTQQLEWLNRFATFLPDENHLQEYDFTALLPYVDLISEDSLSRIQYHVESSKTNNKEQSKLLKVIQFLKALKEKKLKPFKAAANFGVSLFNKKKETINGILNLGGSSSVTTTPQPVYVPETSTLPGGFPIFYPPTLPPQYIPGKPIFPTFPIQSAPLNEEQLQQQQPPLHQQQQDQLVQPQQPQPIAPFVRQNEENRLAPFLPVHQVQGFRQITPASNYLGYPHPSGVVVPPSTNEIVETSPLPYFQYVPPAPSYYRQPIVRHHDQYAANFEPTQSPYPPQKIKTNFHTDEPYLSSKYSNVFSYQTAEHPNNFQSQNYNDNINNNNNNNQDQRLKTNVLTPADTYLINDLTGSASDNVEKIKEKYDRANDTDMALKGKDEQNVGNVENYISNSSPKPKITKLRPVTVKPPVYIYPESSAESKFQNSEYSQQVTNSTTYEPKE